MAQGVTIQHVSRRGHPPALENVDLEIADGEFFCLIGPSGCGKTTMMSVFAGFVPVTAGTAMIHGNRIDGPSPERGVVFQDDDALFGWLSAIENVEFGLRMRGTPTTERQAVAKRFVDLVGLGSHESKLPHELSGGMRKRVQIARVLANDAEVLLMDEPFAALDAQARAIMQAELERIWAATGKTILFITHDIEEAIFLADRVGLMTNGPRASIREFVEVTLPRPRDRTSDEFAAVLKYCLTVLTEEVARSSFGQNEEPA